MPDVVAELGHIALGSRLKRLAERLLADAAMILEHADIPVQPTHVILLAALDRYGPMSLGSLVSAMGFSQPAVTRMVNSLGQQGFITTSPDKHDKRSKIIALNDIGRDVLAKTQNRVWNRVGPAVAALCGGQQDALLALIARVEASLGESSMINRVANQLTIHPWHPDHAQTFHDINVEWITAMFALEAADRATLEHPQAKIIDQGGDILFIEASGLGIVGTCALMPHADGAFELTKMGVLESVRGRKAGEALLAAVLQRAQEMDIKTLFLLTNKACEAAIHLYEKLGFVHDADIMARYGCNYQRCDVAMLYVGSGSSR